MPENDEQQSTSEGVENADAQVEQDSTQPGAESQSGTEETPPHDGEPNDHEDTDDSDGAGRDADLPEWAQRERKSLRKEAANYRTALRTVEAQLEEARKAGQDVAALQSTVSSLTADLAREKALRLHPVPEALQQFVTATTEEEAIAQAKALAENLGTPPKPRDTSGAGGGLDPNAGQGSRRDPSDLARDRFPRR